MAGKWSTCFDGLSDAFPSLLVHAMGGRQHGVFFAFIFPVVHLAIAGSVHHQEGGVVRKGMRPSEILELGMSSRGDMERLSWECVKEIKFPTGFKPSRAQFEIITKLRLASGGKFNSRWVEQKARDLPPDVFRKFFLTMMAGPVVDSLIDEVTNAGGMPAYPAYAELMSAVDVVCTKWDPAIVRLVLVSILDDDSTTAKRTILQVLCNHRLLRLEGFPELRADVTIGQEAQASQADALVALKRLAELLAEGRRPLDPDIAALRRFADIFSAIVEKTSLGDDPSISLDDLVDLLSEPELSAVDMVDHETLEHVLAVLESGGESSADVKKFVELCHVLVANAGIATTEDQAVFLVELCELLRLIRIGVDAGDTLHKGLKKLRSEFPTVVLVYLEGGFARSEIPRAKDDDVAVTIPLQPPSPGLDSVDTAVDGSLGVSDVEQMVFVESAETVNTEFDPTKSGRLHREAPAALRSADNSNSYDGTGESKQSRSKHPTPRLEQPEDSVPADLGESSPSHEAVDCPVIDEKMIIELMEQGRLGLARAVAEAGNYLDLAELLGVAVLQSESRKTLERNPISDEAVTRFDNLDLEGMRRNSFHRALSEIVAVCGALQTGYEPYTRSLHVVANETGDAPAAELFRAVAQVPYGGLALSTSTDRSASSISAREQAVRDAREFALKAPSKNIKYHFALVAWKALTQATGRIGKVVKIVAEDDATKIEEVIKLIDALQDEDEVIESAVKEIPNAPRGTKIHSGARITFVRYLSEPKEFLTRWVAGVEAERNVEVPKYWEDPGEFAKQVDKLINRIIDQAPEAYRLALTTTIESTGMRFGRRESTVDFGIRPDDVLGYEIDSEISIPDGGNGYASTEIADLLRADWASERPDELDSVRKLFQSGRFLRASRVLAVVRSRGLDVDEDTERVAEWAERDLATTRDNRIKELRALLGEARALDATTQLSDNDASSILNDIELALELSGVTDLVHAVKTIEQRIGEMKSRLEEASVELRASVEFFRESGRISAQNAEQMSAAIDRFNFRAVQTRIWRLNDGLSDSSTLDDPFGFKDFYANHVVRASGIDPTQRSVDAIARGGKVGGIEFPGFREDHDAEKSAALTSWITLNSLSARDRGIENVHKYLPAVLRMIGLESRRMERAKDDAAGPGRLWVDLQEVDRSGRAMLPSFGSLMEDRTIRLLVQFEEMNAKRLLEVVNLDRSGRQILVVYLGSLGTESRHLLATLCRRQHLLAPVLDWPLLLEMVRKPSDSRFERFIHLAAPFAWTNPYVPNVQGRVPLELFYGRAEEVTKILDPAGPTFVYGGRQLGKSALLRRSAAQIEEREANAVGIYIDLNYHSVGSARSPERVWELIAGELEKRVDRGFEPNVKLKGFDRVEDMVGRWLEQDGTRRLLILLDECDRMLTQDMNSHYEVSNQIRGIIESTNRRCKVVLAGLNSVQRRYKGFDHPMAHLAGEAIEVGPLKGADAFKLVAEPLNVIGLSFSEEDAFGIDMILTATNDQPSLIQLVCHRLVDQIRQGKLTRELTSNTIMQSTIDAVLTNSATMDDLRKRFEWTIDLDHRYKAIAYRVVLQFKEKNHSNEPATLYEMCRQDYPRGFENCTLEEFRWYLDELRTFGILQKTRTGEWVLRSPNIATMFGPYEEVEQRLRKLTLETPYEDVVPANVRARVGDGLSPFTLDQHQKIGTESAGPCFVVASTVLGGALVREAIEMTASELSLNLMWFESDGNPDPLHYVNGSLTVVDIRSWDNNAAASLVYRAIESRVPCRTIVILRPSQASALDPEDERVIHLRMWDENSLRWWFGSENIAYADHDLEKILSITGGCHSILADVVRQLPLTMEQFIDQCEKLAQVRHDDGFGIVSSGTEIDDAKIVLELLVAGDTLADLGSTLADLGYLYPPSLFTIMRHAAILGGTSRGLIPMKHAHSLLT